VKRTIYLSIFVVLSAAAGLLYYNHTRQATVLIANRDLAVGTSIQDADVALRAVNPGSLAGHMLSSPEQAIGQVVALPILAGDFIDARQIAPMKNAQLLTAGLQLPPGYRIIGLPVTPSAAVGGALKAGDTVDVLAMDNPSKVAALADEPAPAPTMLGKNVLVIGLRTDQGASTESADHGLNSGSNRPSTVLLAIPQIDEATYSAAIAHSSFVLTLSTE